MLDYIWGVRLGDTVFIIAPPMLLMSVPGSPDADVTVVSIAARRAHFFRTL